jgi:glycosyltransferase involved in cell wall biosynthesis
VSRPTTRSTRHASRRSRQSHDPIPADVDATLRSDPRIHLAGLVHDMPSVYCILDLLVLPTYREGFGMALLEAAAMELPVVATRIPGCVDAVRDGETGLLAPARDAEALTAAIRIYLTDAELRRQHGANGRHRALRDFDPEAIREALFREYLRLLGERGCAEVVKYLSPVAPAAGALTNRSQDRQRARMN